MLSEERRDDLESAALYDLLQNSVAPKFYDRDDNGVPARWVEMVRHTLQSLGPKVLASRMVRDYTEQYYAPAAASLRRTVEPIDGLPFGAGPRTGRLPAAGGARPGRMWRSPTSTAPGCPTPRCWARS